MPPEDAIFTVHVAGAVKNPGVYSLPAATRVNDAVSAAGGLAGDADADAVNLAARLVDAARIFVPYRGRPVPSVVATPEASSSVETTATASGLPGDQNPATGMVDLNTADVAALDALPGIGPATAGAIVEYRQRNGPFRSVSQLLDVSGIGDAKLANIRSRVKV